jgi:hypothetical protein
LDYGLEHYKGYCSTVLQSAIHNLRDWCCHLVKKPTFGLMAAITLEVVPSASAIFFKCILEAISYEGVQHSLRFCLHYFSCVKMAAFQFYLQSGKQK